jgi:nicotinamidase/pyrazinamidase
MNEARTFDRIVTIDVDVQKDFCEGGNLPAEDGDEVVGPLNEVNEWTRENGGTVVFTGDDHPPETIHFGDPPDFDTTWPPHCVHGTEGAEFHDELVVGPDDIIVRKGTRPDEHGYSGFEGRSEDGQTLEAIITAGGQDKVAVILGGIATDRCVESTTFDGLELARKRKHWGQRIAVFVLLDAVRPVKKQTGDQAIGEMQAAGARMVTSAQIVSGGLIRKREV